MIYILSHPRRYPEPGPVVKSLLAELLLDPEQLILLGGPLPPARRSRLDLTGAQTDRQISNVQILRLDQSMGRHDSPTTLLGKLHSVYGLRYGPDLIHLQ